MAPAHPRRRYIRGSRHQGGPRRHGGHPRHRLFAEFFPPISVLVEYPRDLNHIYYYLLTVILCFVTGVDVFLVRYLTSILVYEKIS